MPEPCRPAVIDDRCSLGEGWDCGYRACDCKERSFLEELAAVVFHVSADESRFKGDLRNPRLEVGAAGYQRMLEAKSSPPKWMASGLESLILCCSQTYATSFASSRLAAYESNIRAG